ncbi:MAG: D-alanyl-D-alanine carboxypeptidase/D-alanyl-D-alanine-endopeptidase, partial [Armatimonadetes bacterium]|nr:D-alanyl-D-alanine carboxypeptidase/D-alanyl-D-alanine-endopeptidase [Armatimonadota bacterium]
AINKKGSSNAGAEAETEFLRKIGADVAEVSINDGSGLCRSDYVSPKNLVAILTYMYRHNDSKAYIDSLPIAGVDGTLRSRMKGTAAERNVHAKTGYIARVSTISGYVTTKSGEPLVFSIMMNHHLCPNSGATAIQNKILTALANLEE